MKRDKELRMVATYEMLFLLFCAFLLIIFFMKFTPSLNIGLEFFITFLVVGVIGELLQRYTKVRPLKITFETFRNYEYKPKKNTSKRFFYQLIVLAVISLIIGLLSLNP